MALRQPSVYETVNDQFVAARRKRAIRRLAQSPLAEAAAGCETRRQSGGQPAGCLARAVTRIAFYSDEPVLAAGVGTILARDPALQLTACCLTISELLDALVTATADIALLDFTPDLTADVLSQIRLMASGCKLVLWTHAIEGEMAMRALHFGIRGVLRKNLSWEVQRQCLDRISSGGLWFERQVSGAVN